jgi:hypothetical protein
MSIAYSDLIVYATGLEGELDHTICTIQLWGEIDTPHHF